MSQSQSQNYITTDGQSARLPWCQAPIWGPKPDFYHCQTIAGLLMWGALSDERTGLLFTIVAGPLQRSHSRVRVLGDSWPYFTVSDSRFPQPGGPGPRIHVAQGQVGPIIPPGTGFPFLRLLRLAGLRWRYSTPPTRGDERLSKSQNYFTIDVLPSISSSWRQAPWGSRPEIFFLRTEFLLNNI
jgi:hypothetical protein